jgi:hypothetical protein
MPGAGRTHGPPATRKAGGSHHRQGQNIPAFPERWFYGLYVRSPESGLVSLRRLAASSSARLDPSVGGPGLHDFAVRQDAFVRAPGALSIPPSTASLPQRS